MPFEQHGAPRFAGIRCPAITGALINKNKLPRLVVQSDLISELCVLDDTAFNSDPSKLSTVS
jgi:hypothetical protein